MSLPISSRARSTSPALPAEALSTRADSSFVTVSFSSVRRLLRPCQKRRLLIRQLADLDEDRGHDVEDLADGLLEDGQIASVVLAILGHGGQTSTLPSG